MGQDPGSRLVRAAFLTVSFAVQPFLLLMLAAPRAAFTLGVVGNNLEFGALGAVYGALAGYAAARNWSLKPHIVASVHVDAPPEAVWKVIADVTRSGEWSGESRGWARPLPVHHRIAPDSTV